MPTGVNVILSFLVLTLLVVVAIQTVSLLREKDQQRILLFKRICILVTIIIILIVCNIVTWPAWLYNSDDLKKLKKQGNEIKEKLEDYRLKNGKYPIDIRESQIVLPKTKYGRWQYEIDSQGIKYYLRVGHYGDNGFVMYGDSVMKGWGIDR
ncbi:MAG: hypothetical protein A2283_13435 [Lentisphaerae bacterium RIFOXYA12_FULL_48_11]|nr:MAG: hypothetical protein A2283_13435 [Lentisphaerae bacterium RIFOXYA12_FULL_48_11]